MSRPLSIWLVESGGIFVVALLAGAWWLTFRSSSINAAGRNDSPPLLFDGLLFACLLAGRWPTFGVPWALGVDEAQMIAQAHRCLEVDWLPWRGFDGNSGGPLDSWVLVIPALLGLPLGYGAARVVACVLWSVTLVATYRTLLHIVTPMWARAAMLPFVAFLSLTRETELVHYTSEAVPVALLALSVWILVARAKGSGLWTSAAGAALGAVPFAKLQAGPVGLTVGALALVALARSGARGRVWALLAGAVAPAAVIGSMLLATGAARDFALSYVAWGLEYASESVDWVRYLELFGRTASFKAFYFHLVVLLAFAMLAGWHARRGPARRASARRDGGSFRLFGATICFLAASLAVVRIPNRLFDHYLFFVVAPFALLVAVALDWSAQTPAASARAVRLRAILPAAICAGCLLLQIFAMPRSGSGIEHRREQRLSAPLHVATPAEVLRRISRPGDTLLVWGWQPGLYVESGLVPATRDAITFNQIEPVASRPYFRQRFLQDLDASRPPLVVDTVGRGSYRFSDRSDGVQSFGSLSDRLAADYVPLSTWLGTTVPDGMPSIYLRESRVEALGRGDFGRPEHLRQQIVTILEAALSGAESMNLELSPRD